MTAHHIECPCPECELDREIDNMVSPDGSSRVAEESAQPLRRGWGSQYDGRFTAREERQDA